LLLLTVPVRADQPFGDVAEKVNQKLVKIFGAGGFKGLVSYGTGAVVTRDGYILTVNSLMLTSQNLRVHLADGRRFQADLVATEPELDVALIKIKDKRLDNLDHFDIARAAERPVAEAGTGILAFSNTFQIATRSEPMSVQQGVIAAYAKLPLRRGVFEAPYNGEVYVVDTIMCNPGAAGGVITTRKGELLGLIGRELRNNLTDTWINYAIPIQAKAQGLRNDKPVTVTVLEVVEKKEAYVQTQKKDKKELVGGHHGIIFVPNVVERTPPYVEEVIPGSPAAKAGLKSDDLIVYFNGEQVVSVKNFKELIDPYPLDTELQLEVRRGDRLISVKMKLEKPKK
jgi:serine protease Do